MRRKGVDAAVGVERGGDLPDLVDELLLDSRELLLAVAHLRDEVVEGLQRLFEVGEPDLEVAAK